MKKLYKADIVENRPLAPDIYSMKLWIQGYEPSLAGQFVNLYLEDGIHPLPRPISICCRQSDCIQLVYKSVGEGSRLMSKKKVGETMTLSSPLGTGFTLPPRGEVLLVGGGLGVAPLLQTAKECKQQGLSVTALLGYRDVCFLQEEYASLADSLYIATEDGSRGYRGNALQLFSTLSVSKETVILSCGPKPMLKALCSYCKKQSLPLQVSLEERMGCGYGACVGCAVQLSRNGVVQTKRVCKDGPVFDGWEVLFS